MCRMGGLGRFASLHAARQELVALAWITWEAEWHVWADGRNAWLSSSVHAPLFPLRV